MGQFFSKLPSKCAVVLGAICLALPTAEAEIIGELVNKAGGKTVITDEDCPINEAFFYGVASSKTNQPMSFCWGIQDENVIMYFPFNKQIAAPINNFKEPNGKTRT